MPIATHIIKLEGTFTEDWDEEKLKNYVKRKIKEIDKSWHTDLELFSLKENNIKVWVYVQEAALGLANEQIVGKWIKDHIIEEGISVIRFDVEKLPYEDGFVVTLNDVGLENL